MKGTTIVDYSDRLEISFYKTISTINESHKIYLVQHQETGKIYVKKILDVYSINVYKYLKENPITGIPQIIAYYEEAGTLTLIEDYVSGITLKEKIESSDLTAYQVGQYMINLCDILYKLHTHNPALIHRDLKPSNIIITNYDKVMLLDFNAAKYHSNDTNRESDTVLLGTQGYAAPEQYGFGESSPQTDIYSLGIIMKEAIHVLTSYTHEFDAIISKCTQIDPKQRYQSVSELRNELASLFPDDYQQQKTNNNTLGSFLPPGFRSHTLWKMVVAVPSYIFLIMCALAVESRNTNGAANWLERSTLLIVFIGSVFMIFNYRNIQNYLPFTRSKNLFLRILGIVLSIIIFFFVMLLILMMIETSFYSTT